MGQPQIRIELAYTRGVHKIKAVCELQGHCCCWGRGAAASWEGGGTGEWEVRRVPSREDKSREDKSVSMPGLLEVLLMESLQRTAHGGGGPE